MTNRPILIFDLDDTLIHSDIVRRHVEQSGKPWGVTKKTTRAIGKKIRQGTPFTIQNFVKELFPNETSKRKIIIDGFNQLLQQGDKLLYPGVVPFLKDLAKRYKLVAVTYGDKKIQRQKLKYTGLENFFDQIIITNDVTKLVPLMNLRKKNKVPFLFLENSDTVCKDAEAMGIATIKVKRSFKDKLYFATLKQKIKKKLG